MIVEMNLEIEKLDLGYLIDKNGEEKLALGSIDSLHEKLVGC